jgi:tRNA threonylcarbamoyladenosine biosynthesis protein TsaB
MLLAIDTATRFMSLALHDGKELLADLTLRIGNQHTEQLAPTIRATLASCEVTMDDLTALAVSIGPGSFTGLRIGVALAKGLAAARHLPLVGVSSHDTLAAAHPQISGGLIAIVQAGRGRIIVKTYRWRKGRWNSHAEPQLMGWETLFSSIDGPATLIGEISQDGFEAMAAAQAKGTPVSAASPAVRLRRAGVMADIAWQQLNDTADKRTFAPSKLLPVYVKTDDTP